MAKIGSKLNKGFEQIVRPDFCRSRESEPSIECFPDNVIQSKVKTDDAVEQQAVTKG